jgi:hypothetical protein
MLKVHHAPTKELFDVFVNAFMSGANRKGDWAVVQPDRAQMVFPSQFVIVAEHRISLATIHILN